MRQLHCDLCIIGAGAAGLAVAERAARLGLSVVLFEKGEVGGARLHNACTPSKALLEAAHLAHAIRGAGDFGISTSQPQVHWSRVRAHVQDVIEKCASASEPERLDALEIRVIREAARFADPRSVQSASARVTARRFVIATGSKPVAPEIPGVDDVTVHTNETIFALDPAPTKLFILGGTPVGLELGQAFQRIGVGATIIEQSRALRGVDREAYDLITAQVRKDGVELLEGWRATKAMRGAGDSVRLELTHQSGAKQIIAGSHLLTAGARAPNVSEIGLEVANVAFDEVGIKTGADLRSVSNLRVWAIGDVNGRACFTHAAEDQAERFIRAALFKAPVTSSAIIPSAIFTDPELAQIGLTEDDARRRHGDAVRVARWPFAENGRAQMARATAGFCKLVLTQRGRILGATMVGAAATELIAPIALAMRKGLGVSALAEPALPSPTRSEIIKRAAASDFERVLLSRHARRIVRWLQHLP